MDGRRPVSRTAVERYTALQNSRNAAPGAQFVDPTRDWATDSADKVHTVTTSDLSS